MILMSLGAWVLEGSVIFLSVQALDLTARPGSAWLGLVAGNLGTLLPGTPGHFGTFHYLCANALSLGGPTFSESLLATTIGHLTIWSVISITGLIALATSNKFSRLTPTSTPAPGHP